MHALNGVQNRRSGLLARCNGHANLRECGWRPVLAQPRLRGRPARASDDGPRERGDEAGKAQMDSDVRNTTSQGPSSSDKGPVQLVQWGGRLPSRRRLLISGSSAAAIVLGGNLGGITTALLGVDGGTFAARTHLDVLVPVLGHKRCLDYSNGFEFTYPDSWLADQTVAIRQAQKQEAERSLDPPSLRRARAQTRQIAEPVVAFGPPGSTGEENVSVIVAPIMAGFSLTQLGSPERAAKYFLENIIAPDDSGVFAEFISARARVDAAGQQYYVMEYVVERPGKFRRHNYSSYAVRGTQLLTFNAQCPETLWSRDGEQLKQSAESFVLLP